jgi:Tol biopolymer transport system component
VDYAPDGRTVAVSRAASRKVQLEFPAGKVIYTTSGYFDYVRVSPTGNEVAFLEHPVYDDDRGWVSVIDASGNRKQLTREFSTLQGLAWSPAGKEIWFTAADTTDRQLFAVSLSGKQREVSTEPQAIRILDIAADGRVLLAVEQSREEIAGFDPASGKERRGLEWFNGSGLTDISQDGKAVLISEWGGPAGPLYLVVYRKLEGSAPVALGPGAGPRFSPDGTLAAAVLFTRPPQVVLHPIGAGESRQLPVGDIVNLDRISWFPDGKHLLINGAEEGQPLRTYKMDLAGGKPQPLGPPDFTGVTVSLDGKRIAGYKTDFQTAVFDSEAGSTEIVLGTQAGEQIRSWTDDGHSLLVGASTPGEAKIYRVELPSGKRTLLQKVELAQKSGATGPLRFVYSEHSKAYAYATRRILGNLYVVEGLK